VCIEGAYIIQIWKGIGSSGSYVSRRGSEGVGWEAGSALNGDSTYCGVGPGDVVVMADGDVVCHSQIYAKGFYENLAY